MSSFRGRLKLKLRDTWEVRYTMEIIFFYKLRLIKERLIYRDTYTYNMFKDVHLK